MADAFERHDLKLAPAHALPDGDGVLLGDDAAAIDVARLDLADADDVGAELEGLLLEMPRGLGGGGKRPAIRGDLAVEARVLIVEDLLQQIGDFGNADRAAADRRVPVVPGEGGGGPDSSTLHRPSRS